MALSMSSGSLLWGSVAEAIGIGPTQQIAAVGLLITAAIGSVFRLGRPRT
jgi:hypothetical protein